WRQARAKVLALQGAHAEAERYALEAVAVAEQTDMLDWHGRALVDLAQVLALGGYPERAAAELERNRSLRAQGKRRGGGEGTRGAVVAATTDPCSLLTGNGITALSALAFSRCTHLLCCDRAVFANPD